ncbi:hypothetical protein BJ138DRAFT_1142104 [Hygrophoropsis aurantiaca]|uniref:Uncharacterized protein n=1 Tax=Hygrophoropsis aurantiaca TaxID=72124 RepID=A0ACB8AR76_9AGAM|nr:hypothetical protein BJ138DRAFT_1142104 [Hygrophoropsis aurantiaca]
MATLDDFEATLKEVVQAKRLSASKMTKLTEIALKSLEHDTQLVTILYRTHKSLSTSAKVSSLYAFDALARAARHQVTKRGITGDINSEKGNAATFLLKIEGVLDGLFQDMISANNPETKEKTKKVLDIWIKSNTFPSAVLTRLRDMMTDVQKEAAVNPSPAIDPRVSGQAPLTITPTSASEAATPPIPETVQSTLLALLGQAAQVAGQPLNGQIPTNTNPSAPVVPQLDQAQLTLLHQLALTAKLGNGSTLAQPAAAIPLSSPITPTSNTPPHAPPHAPTGPSHAYSRPPPTGPSNQSFDPRRGDIRNNRYGPSERSRDLNETQDDRSYSRGGFRGGYRGRGRDRWDDRGRDNDRFRHRDNEWKSPPQSRHSRSRSPRRFSGRRDTRPYSPPRRPSVAKEQPRVESPFSSGHEFGKDEFGRDIRASSATPSNSVSAEDNRTQPSATSVSVDPAPTSVPALDYHIPVSKPLSTVAANTSTQKPDSHTSSSTTSQPKLDQFEITTFDFTAPTSWEALGKMWQATYSYPPSQEELMQFIMAGGTAAVAPAAGHTGETQQNQWVESAWEGPNLQRGGHRGSSRGGRGRGGYARGGHNDNFGRGNYQDNEQWGYNAGAPYNEHTDAIVLGGDDGGRDVIMGTTTQIPGGPDHLQENIVHTPQPTGPGGRMQRIGDKWVFVKGNPSEAS